MASSQQRSIASHTLLAQSVYYLATGLWPLFDLDSFLLVTGPKTDLWLVRTVGMLLAVAGASMLTARIKRRISAETALLAVGCCVGLTLVDLVYVIKGVLPAIYLLDAAAELLLLGFWYYGFDARRSQTGDTTRSDRPVEGPEHAGV